MRENRKSQKKAWIYERKKKGEKEQKYRKSKVMKREVRRGRQWKEGRKQREVRKEERSKERKKESRVVGAKKKSGDRKVITELEISVCEKILGILIENRLPERMFPRASRFYEL